MLDLMAAELDNPTPTADARGKIYRLRCYVNDKQFAEVDAEERNMRDIKKQALAVMLAFEQVKLVAIVSFDIHTGKTQEKFRLTPVDARPWYVDVFERYGGEPVVHRFADKKEARKFFKKCEDEQMICSTNSLVKRTR